MTGFAYFIRPCPACGRKSQIALDYLGKQVRCKHCSRIFMADDSQAQSEALNDPVSYCLNFTSSEIDNRHLMQFDSRRLPR